MTGRLLGLVALVLVAVCVDAALGYRERRRWGAECTRYSPCPECEHEPPSNLDRWDGVR
jgi:hypothetical protein